MATFTQKDEFGRFFIDGSAVKIHSDMLGRFYGEAIDRFAELEHGKNDEKEKLTMLVMEAVGGCARHWAEIIANHLLANGVSLHPKRRDDDNG